MNIRLTLLLSLVSFALKAQPCNSIVERYVDKSDPYHYQSRGNGYCEGTVARKPVSGRNIQVASVLVGTLRFNSDENDIVFLKAPNSEKGSVNVEIRSKSYTYRLDTQLPVNTTFTWQLANVVKPKNVTASQLFVLGYTGRPENPTYVAIEPSITKTSTPPGQPVTAILLADEELQAVQWRFAEVENGQCSTSKSKWFSLSRTASFTANSRIDIPLSTQIKVKGEYCIDVKAEATEGTSEKFRNESFRVLVP